MADAVTEVRSAEDALERLIKGNERFATSSEIRPRPDSESLRMLKDGQQPFATILGCADSRIPPELIFDQGPGDLFVIRVAGNVVDEHVVGSIEFAVAHLHTPLVMVLGHEDCGAVTAAMESSEQRDTQPPGLRAILNEIEPAVRHIDRGLDVRSRVHLGVEANVRWSMRRLAESDWLARSIHERRVQIVGARFVFDTRRVDLIGADDAT